jgi:hypothetical protein
MTAPGCAFLPLPDATTDQRRANTARLGRTADGRDRRSPSLPRCRAAALPCIRLLAGAGARAEVGAEARAEVEPKQEDHARLAR